jgi:hypothetical protein
MHQVKARRFVTLDSVIEAPENWVKPDDEMFSALEADYDSQTPCCSVVAPTRPSPHHGPSAAAMCQTLTG